MSAEIINLRQARKQRERNEKDARAAENRARFGRTKAERALEDDAQARAARALDGHEREPTASPEEAPTSTPDPKSNR